MRQKDGTNRMMMTGIRKRGEENFHFKIFGNASSQFPPLILKMSLHEMQEWLREMRQSPAQPGDGSRAGLRLVS